ncbi:MAG TPA: PD-(D/E)XK nuclease family protein [Synergistaceae bacterium]|nr:PD-(D/E)XK nuclease family protein [Synergistaceae bacterium]
MGLILHSYTRVHEIWEDSSFASLRERNTLFVIPSGKERPWVLEQLRGGKIFDQPRSVYTWSGLVRFLAERLEEEGLESTLRRQIDPPDHWIILRHLWSGLCERAPSEKLPRGMRHPGFVRQAGRMLREMLREDVSFTHLRTLWGCSCSPGELCKREDPQGWFCCLLGAYENYLEEHDLADSAQIASLGADLFRLPRAREALSPFFRQTPLAFIGFLSFASGQLRLVRELISLGGEVHLWVPRAGLPSWDPRSRRGHYTAADQLECGAERREDSSYPGKLHRLSGGDRGMTPEVLARELALWSRGKGHFGELPFPSWEKMALVVPREESRYLEEALDKYGLPYTVADSFPLSSTSLWGLFRRMVSLALEGWPGEDTARLMGHPFFGGTSFPLEKALQALPRGADEWRRFLEKEGSSEIRELWKGLDAYGTFLLRGGPPKQILEKTRELFHTVLGIADKGHLLAESSEKLDFLVRALHGVLQELERKILFYQELVPDVGEAAEGSLKGREVPTFLEIWAEETSLLPPPALRNSMLLFRDAPPILFECSTLCWLGVTPSRWPGSLGEAPFLSDEERASLEQLDAPDLPRAHLPLVPERRMARHALFRRILATASREVICCAPLQDSQGRPLGESPFLAAAGTGKNSWMEESLPRLERTLGEYLPSSGEWHFQKVEVLGDLPGKERVLPEKRFKEVVSPKGSLSRLDAFRECPFRYYAEKLLEAPPGVFEYDPRKAGSLIHILWEKLFSREEALSKERFLELWNPLVKEHYPELLGALRRREMLLRYQAFRGASVLEEMEQRLRKSLKERKTEKDVCYHEPSWQIPFYGRADRLDFLEGDALVILDYKLGKGEKHKNSLQLGAYALALQEEGLPVKGWLYFGLRDRKMVFWGDEALGNLYLGTPERGKNKVFSPEEGMEEARKVLQAWGASLAEGIYAPRYESSNCSGCPYRTLCRREEAYWKNAEEDAPDE